MLLCPVHCSFQWKGQTIWSSIGVEHNKTACVHTHAHTHTTPQNFRGLKRQIQSFKTTMLLNYWLKKNKIYFSQKFWVIWAMDTLKRISLLFLLKMWRTISHEAMKLSWKLKTVFTVLSQSKINWVKYGGTKLLVGIVESCLIPGSK